MNPAFADKGEGAGAVCDWTLEFISASHDKSLCPKVQMTKLKISREARRKNWLISLLRSLAGCGWVSKSANDKTEHFARSAKKKIGGFRYSNRSRVVGKSPKERTTKLSIRAKREEKIG